MTTRYDDDLITDLTVATETIVAQGRTDRITRMREILNQTIRDIGNLKLTDFELVLNPDNLHLCDWCFIPCGEVDTPYDDNLKYCSAECVGLASAAEKMVDGDSLLNCEACGEERTPYANSGYGILCRGCCFNHGWRYTAEGRAFQLAAYVYPELAHLRQN